uniref:Protein phosphatase 1 regulatory subunit 37 n=1 Tax=Clastoptera arizonana TaxID=38151 RepID=A0A1B6DCG1_9HEMI
MIENVIIDSQTGTTLNTGSVPSCLRNNSGSNRKKLGRRVSFPEDDQQIVTGFLEPANPWAFADNADREELESIYILSCKKHSARPLSPVLNQIQKLDFNLERNENLNLKGEFLSLAECESLEEILKRIQFCLINLETTCLDDEAAVAMFDMMEYYESATRLNIAGNHTIGARGWQACSHMIKRTKCLEELDARNTTLNEQFMPILSRALRLSTQLHVLKLENCNLSGRPIGILAAALKLNTALKELYLGENYLSVSDAMQLGSLLKVNTTLQLLDISNNNIQDAGLGHLSEGLSEQSSSGAGLAGLILWNNHLTRNASSYLVRVLTNSKTLEMLNIGQNVLSNEMLHATKDALQKNKSLLRLGMQSTHLTCEGAIALAEIIADNSVLQRIDLRDNNIQVAGLMALALSMNVNTNISRVDLDNTPRRKHSMGPSLDEYVRLVAEIRSFCQRNESTQVKLETKTETNEVSEKEPVTTPEKRSRIGSFACRKISLTCETLMRSAIAPSPEPATQHLNEPKRSSGRLRSPAPSPIPSPVASPSPTRNRFQVSKVSESNSPVTPSTSPNSFFGSTSSSRFKVTVVDNSSPSTSPTPVLAGNNVTLGFETPPTLTLSPTPAQIASGLPTVPSPLLSVTISPSPSISPTFSSPCPVVTSFENIPMLFPTPLPSPVPSPVPSTNFVALDHSSFEEKPTSDNTDSSQLVPSDDKSVCSDRIDKPFPNVLDSNHPQYNNTNEVISTNIHNEININSNCDSSVENVIKRFPPNLPSSPSISVSSQDSISSTKEKSFRSDSEESDREVIHTRSKLPKATDSLDLSLLQAMRQPSISVVEKPTQRSRKISWVQPGSMFSTVTSQDDSSKPPSSLERLLSLFNPFSKQKIEEEPSLLSVPESSEKTSQSDNVSVSESKHFSVTHTVDKIVQSISEISVSSCLNSVNSLNSQLESIMEHQPIHCDQLNSVPKIPVISEVIDESNLKSDVKFDNPPTDFLEIHNEIRNELTNTNESDSLNNNTNCEEENISEIKCETWPQGRMSLTGINIVRESQSKSAPCLAALVYLQSKMASDLAADLKKLSPSQSDDSMESSKNITWAF